MRLRPGLRVLTRTNGEVQVGTDPRWAVRLDGLTERETAAVLALGAGADSDQLAAGTGARLAQLATLLRDAGLAAPDRRSPAVLGPAAAPVSAAGHGPQREPDLIPHPERHTAARIVRTPDHHLDNPRPHPPTLSSRET